MHSDNSPRRNRLLTRRALLLATATSGAAFLTIRSATALQAVTDHAMPAASPVATPMTLAVASPTTEFPLEVIRDQRPVEATAPVAGGTLHLHIQSASLTDFSPVNFRQDFQVACSLYDPLVWLDDVTCEPQPWLAESWDWSIDGLTLMFRIRDDVTWHDGSPLTAEDVAFSFLVYQQDYDSAVSGFFALVTNIESTDDHTVRVTFAAKDGGFIFTAGNLLIFQAAQYGFAWSTLPVGERSLNGYDWANNPPIGTGPWRLDAASDQQLDFTRSDDYWAGLAHADELVLIAEEDYAARMAAWHKDEVDIVWPVPPLETADLLPEPGRLYAADSLRTIFAAYNFDNPARVTTNLFASIELRQALLLAMDRDAYQQSIYGSFIDTAQAGSVTQPWARDERIVNPARNVKMANRLLDSIGWLDNDGDGIRETPAGDILSLVAIVPDDAPVDLVAILQSLDRSFRDIGVRLAVDQLDSATWSDRWVNTHDFDLIGYSLIAYGAFNEFNLYGTAWDIRANTNGWNPGGYTNAAVDAALDEWFAAVEQHDMQIALYKLQRAVTDDPFGLFFGFPQDPVLVRPGVLGFQPNKIWQSWNTRLLWKTDSTQEVVTKAGEA